MKMQRKRVVSFYWRALENQSDDTDKKLEDWDMNSPTKPPKKRKTVDLQSVHKETKSRTEIHACC